MKETPDSYFMDADGNLLRMTDDRLEVVPEVTEPIPDHIHQMVANAYRHGMRDFRNVQGAVYAFREAVAAVVENLSVFGEEILVSDGGGEPLPEFDPTLERICDPTSGATETDFSDSLSRQIASGEIVVAREDVDIDEVIAKIDAHTQED